MCDTYACECTLTRSGEQQLPDLLDTITEEAWAACSWCESTSAAVTEPSTSTLCKSTGAASPGTPHACAREEERSRAQMSVVGTVRLDTISEEASTACSSIDGASAVLTEHPPSPLGESHGTPHACAREGERSPHGAPHDDEFSGCAVAKGLELGSNDPHMLRLHDDRAPHVRDKPTRSVGMHMAAPSEHLRSRALPLLNDPPQTEPLEPPSPPLPPPVVTAIEQVVPRSTLCKVRTWMRRLRRCLRAAARGDAKLAKRLRPPDLWLSAEEHMLPEVRAWNWDLRPLLIGLPAVPIGFGSEGLLPPSTDLKSLEISADGKVFADGAIISEMLFGIADDSDCARGTLLCAPHQSALTHYGVLEAKLHANVLNEWATGGHELPCWPLRTYPCGVVDESERAGKPKFRLTSDLSWPPPHSMPDGNGGFVDAVNAAMRRSTWPTNKLIRVSQIAEAAAILESSGAPVKLWGFDCTAYYRKMGRRKDELWRNAIAALDGVQLDERCCFGSAADATKCSRVSNYIAWRIRRAIYAVDELHPPQDANVCAWRAARAEQARNLGASDSEIAELWTALFSLGIYIDDGGASSIDDVVCQADGRPVLRDGQPLRRATLHMETALHELELIGHCSAKSKEQWPSLKLESLGMEVNLETKRLRLLSQKRKSYAAKARKVAAMKACPRDTFIALLGRLGFAACCYPLGKAWLHAPWRALRARYRLRDDSVLVSKNVRASLLRWAEALENPLHEGVPLASRVLGSARDSNVGSIYADASGSIGMCAWTVHGGQLLYVVDEWDELEREFLPIHVKELAASTLGLVSFAGHARWDGVYNFTDNVVAQYAMRGSSSVSNEMTILVEERNEWLVAHGVLESPERITSKANLWSDLGSRGRIDEMLRQAVAMKLHAVQLQPPPRWRRLISTLATTAADEAASSRTSAC